MSEEFQKAFSSFEKYFCRLRQQNFKACSKNIFLKCLKELFYKTKNIDKNYIS